MSPTGPVHRRIAAAGIVAVIALGSLPVTTVAVDPDLWAWATIRRPGTSYTVKGKDRRSSSGGKDTVKRLGVGAHRVKFKGVVPSEEQVQVTPLSSAPDFCTYTGPGQAGQAAQATVYCYDRRGRRKDVRFSVNVIDSVHIDLGPRLGYAWINQPKTAVYEPHHLYQFTSNGPPPTAERLGAGEYRITFRKLFDGGGNIQVTPAVSIRPSMCRVVSWVDVGANLSAVVRCTGPDGSPDKTKFNFLYHSGEGLRGDGGGSWAYLFAHRPTAGNYVPDARYRAASPAGTPRVKRLGKGRYSVKLPSMPLGGAVQVNAVSRKKRCHASGIRRTGAPQRIGVVCFNPRGTQRADSKFLLSYVK